MKNDVMKKILIGIVPSAVVDVDVEQLLVAVEERNLNRRIADSEDEKERHQVEHLNTTNGQDIQNVMTEFVSSS